MALPKHVLSVESRSGTGKGYARKLRNKDIVPGIYYTKDDNIPVQAPEIPLWKTYHKAGLSQVFQLEINKDGKKTKTPTMIKEIQFHPTKTKIVHVDFIGIDMKKKLRVNVPVEITGESKGVKEGGVLEVYRDHVEVECLPDVIPENIVIDVSELDVNDSIHVQDVTLPEGVIAVNFDENFAILGVSVPSAMVEEAAEEEEEVLEGEEAEGEEAEGEEESRESSEEAR